MSKSGLEGVMKSEKVGSSKNSLGTAVLYLLPSVSDTVYLYQKLYSEAWNCIHVHSVPYISCCYDYLGYCDSFIKDGQVFSVTPAGVSKCQAKTPDIFPSPCSHLSRDYQSNMEQALHTGGHGYKWLWCKSDGLIRDL